MMSGKPLIALRTSTHAFRFQNDTESSYRHYDFRGNEKWPKGFGKQVLGETWFNHHGAHGSQSTRAVINQEQADSVTLKGVDDVWGPTDVYGVRELPAGTEVLLWGQVLEGMKPDSKPLEGEKNDPMMALAWIRNWTGPSGNTSPIFCTTMGSSTDFESEDLRRLIVNAAYHMTDRTEEITDSLNVDLSLIHISEPTRPY